MLCCVVFLFCVSSYCVPYVTSFSGLSLFDYLANIKKNCTRLCVDHVRDNNTRTYCRFDILFLIPDEHAVRYVHITYG